jgi:hypothetical protein
VPGDIGVAHECADPEAAAGGFLDLVQGSFDTSISLAGRSTSIFIRSTRLVPPAMNFAPGLAAIWRTASATLLACEY